MHIGKPVPGPLHSITFGLKNLVLKEKNQKIKLL